MTGIVHTPLPRRTVWLGIALAVARDGLPEPQTTTLYGDIHHVDIEVDTPAQAATWARHIGATEDRRITSKDGSQWLIRYRVMRDGWRWAVNTTAPVDEVDALSDPLAAQVAGAIEANDRTVVAQLVTDRPQKTIGMAEAAFMVNDRGQDIDDVESIVAQQSTDANLCDCLPFERCNHETIEQAEAALPLDDRPEVAQLTADDDEPIPFVNPAFPPEFTIGFVVGRCGHRVARSEWRAGFRVCEHCPKDATWTGVQA